MPNSGLSSQFEQRLIKLDPDQTVRVMVVLDTGKAAGTGRRQSSQQRQEAIASVRATASRSLQDVQQILSEHGGKLLSSEPNSLGSVPVEAPPQTILALADLPTVRAILEDQPLALLESVQ